MNPGNTPYSRQQELPLTLALTPATLEEEVSVFSQTFAATGPSSLVRATDRVENDKGPPHAP